MMRPRGVAHRLDGQYAQASTCFRSVLDVLRAKGDDGPQVASCLNSLGAVKQYAGEHTAAERDYVEAMSIARRVGADTILAGVLGNLSDLKMNQQLWEQAEPFAREALFLAEKVGRKQLIAKDCLRLARACHSCKRHEEAVPLAERAIVIFGALRIIEKQQEAELLLKEITSAIGRRVAAGGR